MWAVILLILKIIGIALLSILGLLIFLVLIVLLVPVRYKIKAKREGTEGAKPVEAMGKVTWLLHIVSISVAYPADEILKIRLFGIKLKLKGGKKKEEPGSDLSNAPDATLVEADEPSGTTETAASTEATETLEMVGDSETSEPNGASGDLSEIGENEDEPVADSSDVTCNAEEGTDEESEMSEADEGEEEEPSVGGFFRWLEKISYTLRSAYDKMKNKRQEARDRSAERKAKIDEILQVITGEPFRNALHTCLYQLGRILKHIAPQKMLIRCEIGLDDPYTTGRILGIYGMLYPWFWKQVKVVGNFEEEVLRGDAFIRGRIRLISLVVAAAKIYFNKDVKKMIRLFRKKGGK